MLERLPTQRNGRNIHLQSITVDEANICDYDAIWDTILNKAADGEWWRITNVSEWNEGDLKRLHHAIRNRAFQKGYVADVLSVIVTKRDGLCFRWAYGNLDTMNESAKSIRQERMNKRCIRMKRLRAKKRALRMARE